MNILSGYKTYIVALLMILSGGAEMVGIDIPYLEAADATKLAMEGFGMLFIRMGIKKSEV